MSHPPRFPQSLVAVAQPSQVGCPPLGGRTGGWAQEQARRVAVHQQQRGAGGLHITPAAAPTLEQTLFGPCASPSDIDVVQYWRAKRQAIGVYVLHQAAPVAPPAPTRAPPPPPPPMPHVAPAESPRTPTPEASFKRATVVPVPRRPPPPPPKPKVPAALPPVHAPISPAEYLSAPRSGDSQKTLRPRAPSFTDAQDFVWPPSRPAARCAPPSPPLTLQTSNTSSALQPASYWSASPSPSSVYSSTASSDAHTEDGVASEIRGNAILVRGVLYPLRQSKRGDLTYYDKARQRQILVYRHNAP